MDATYFGPASAQVFGLLEAAFEKFGEAEHLAGGAAHGDLDRQRGELAGIEPPGVL